MTDFADIVTGDLDRTLEGITNKAETVKDILVMVGAEAQDTIDALETIKQDAEEVVGELEEHINNLAGLQDSLEKADRIRSDGEEQGISI
tara:strand:- start:1278 stop:1547 length:270 start_codon:yes stop_codon:yes gene_type:complete